MHSARFSNSTNTTTGESLAADDFPFRHFSLRHRVIAWISRRLFDNFTYTVRHGLIRGMKRRGGLGWIPGWLAWGARTKEEVFWRVLPLDGLVVYDVGAFHGILTLFFASRAAHVIAYEPNEANCVRLAENIRLNGLRNVRIRQVAVGSQPAPGTLTYDPAMSGAGSADPGAPGVVRQPIEITTLDRDIAMSGLPAPHLIKIDIEGWELEALQGACKALEAHHPALFLEMHGETMREKKRKAAELVLFLQGSGYIDILHVETAAAVTSSNAAVAAEGHLYCRYTPK